MKIFSNIITLYWAPLMDFRSVDPEAPDGLEISGMTNPASCRAFAWQLKNRQERHKHAEGTAESLCRESRFTVIILRS